jgi:hypothetical protein
MAVRALRDFVFAVDLRERVAFWVTTLAAYGVIAGLATTRGIGYVLTETLVGRTLVVIPEYSPILWLPAVLGASPWGPLAWISTVYWITLAGLFGAIVARLDRRRPARLGRAPRPSAVPGRDRPLSGRPLPSPAADAAPRQVLPRAESER